MNKFFNFGKSLWRDESGATAIEYGLLAALIAVVIIGAVGTLGSTMNTNFGLVASELEDAGATVTTP
ncbi:pilus assembly protein Flp/PilA [Amaricoccus macauensis]|uniref:Pilus assembly protein Flp/PilA n=1 Tax=Amaricoccus macauensis TaxID=57001 RepID=A0A840SSI1_9RHOB|nr:Flp family type IVb pilin [Amaricoccus macauensis]MBB5223548.1 pilus assembly protein Flp/PilA [Amaricoccus macauensis]